jgi:hypothetical protein
MAAARSMFAVATLIAAVPAAAGTWSGKEEVREGVRHVMNPAKAMEDPTTVKLQELWRLGGESEDENEFFGLIGRITADSKGNVYLLDSQLSEVKIYGADGKFLKKIGREGEGPGEFRRPGDMFLLPDGNLGVMQTVPGKIVKLTGDGTPAGDFPLPEPAGGGFQVLRGGQLAGNNLALQRMIQVIDQSSGGQPTKADLVFTIDLVSADGKLLSTMETKTSTLNFASSIITEETFDTFENRWTVGDDGRIYACPSRDNYMIKVWTPDGKLDRVITREYQHYVRTADEKEYTRKIWSGFLKRVPNPDLRISDNDKDINNVYVRDDGSIWVLSAHGARKKPAGSLGTFDVLDADGRFVRQVTLMGQGDPQEDAYFFDKDRIYVVTGFLNAALAAQGGGEAEGEESAEAEDVAPMEVICYRVDAPVLAKGK